MKIFEYDGTVIRTANLLIDLTKLNLLWLLFSLPVVTAGASTAAMYAVIKVLPDQKISVFPVFWSAFKRTFRQSTILWLIFLVLAAAFFMDYHLLTTAEVPARTPLLIISALAFITLIFIALWICPILSFYQGTLRQLVFNAFIFSFMYAPLTLFATAIYALTAYLFLSFFPARVLCIVFGHALAANCSMTLFKMAFRKHPSTPM